MRRWVAAATAAVAATAWAVSPGAWQHETEADFTPGEFDGTIVTSRGQVRLGRQVDVLLASEDAPAVVSAVAVAGDAVYAASGIDGRLFVLRNGKTAELAKLPSTMIVSLRWDGVALLAGTGGEKAGLYRVTPPKEADGKAQVEALWTPEKLGYVWATVDGPDHTRYAATGPEGKVFAIDAAGKAEVLFEAGELAKNVLCLARGPNGLLYAGTDTEGLVVEIDPKAKTSRVLLDADESEIAAILPDEAGGVYVATSDAAKATAEGAAPKDAKDGRAVPAEKDQEDQKPLDDEKPADDEASEAQPAEDGPPKVAPGARPKAENPEAGPTAEPDTAPEAASDANQEEPAQADDGEPTDDAEAGLAKGTVIEAPAETDGETPEEYVRRMAEKARRESAGDAQPRNGPPMMPPGGPSRPVGPGGPGEPGGPAGGEGGNAVYYIQPDGLVRTIFRRPVSILAMVRAGDDLLLGTGNGGDVYCVGLDGDRIARVADTEAKQVTALALADGAVLLATANAGSVARLDEALRRTGTYTSPALDASQRARWGTVQVRAASGPGARVTVATRSGNVAKPDEKTWTDWSKEQPVDGGFLTIGSPAGRFLQYRLTFHGDARATATVDGVRLMYQVPNLPPRVTAVTAQVGKGDNGPPADRAEAFRTIVVEAADPNGDSLTYTLEMRRVADGEAAEPWVQVAEDLTEPKYVWDTRTVADGRYELRVTASDRPGNPPEAAQTARRVSEPIRVDNTPPVLRALAGRAVEGAVEVTGRVLDAGSRLAGLEYAVDSQSDWRAALPTDGIWDSDDETFRFRTEDVKPGAHRVAVRARDAYGNVVYRAVVVTVPA